MSQGDKTPPGKHLNGHANGAPPKGDALAKAGDAPLELDGDDDEGDSPENPAPEPPPDELPAPPPKVAELVAACVRYVGARYGTLPDGTPDTLSLLDQYIRDSRKELAQRPESFPLVAASVGAYLGEVIRTAFVGSWFAEGDYEGWRVDLHSVYLTFNPLGMALEALTLEPAEGWHAHLEMDEEDREGVEERLARLGDVDEEEYYAPTSRFDVVSLAVEELRGRMRLRGLADVRFGPEDYRRR